MKLKLENTNKIQLNNKLLHSNKVKVTVTQSCPTLQARILEWVAFPFSRRSSQPRDQTQVSHIAVDSLPTEPQGKPKNTRVGSLSLLQWIFPTQESDWGLLHYGQILYQLSYQGSPLNYRKPIKLNMKEI